jgi:hypothetical protein
MSLDKDTDEGQGQRLKISNLNNTRIPATVTGTHFTFFTISKVGVQFMHIGNVVYIFCILCILFCIFVADNKQQYHQNLHIACILCNFFLHFVLHILHIDFNCILGIFHLQYLISLQIILHVLHIDFTDI